jgi:hypothetical protein
MPEKDWDDISKEELIAVAPSLLYLKRTFGTSVGNPEPAKPPSAEVADKQNLGKQGS